MAERNGPITRDISAGCPLGRALPGRIENRSPTGLQKRLTKTGSQAVKHAPCYWLTLAESHPASRPFGNPVRRTGALAVAGQAWAMAR